ncbi:unnamed protein product [Kluyveromyces dobzhanskii CBS 2104]|uniref:WGS project CCBQ000000000 data, contig 00010 n=1 Tax=Kluyveromyces dobzhanskii CBS 2104 TaxID=1427455 RepID=A0A0A8LAT5_9SACH|nr:unnamed protein product [Kluyveromyces dobzhanskii CBS 2104]
MSLKSNEFKQSTKDKKSNAHGGMFDTELFLSLSINIRYHVYFFLGDTVQKVRPPAKSDIFNNTVVNYPKVEEYDSSLAEKYSKHVSVYDYIPNFISNWCCVYNLLRHDKIIADRLRVSFLYEEQWFSVQWILVSGQLEIGIFTADEQFLQLSYTSEEYCRILHIAKHELRIGINVSDINDIDELCKEIRSQWLFETVSYISFVNCWDMNHKNVLSIISYLESFNNLTMLRVESKNMFHNLINTQGVRENPGKTIVYNVRQNVLELQLYTLRDVGYKAVVDLNRWEHLRCLLISGCEFIDLNSFSLPPHCKILKLRDVKYVVWWDQSSLLKQVNTQWISNGEIKRPTIGNDSGKEKEEEESQWFKLYVQVIQTYQPLNCIELYNIRRVKGNLILLKRLVMESRIKMPKETKLDSILLI